MFYTLISILWSILHMQLRYYYILCSLHTALVHKFSICRVINYWTQDQHGYYCSSKTSVVLARHYHELCLTMVVVYTKHWNLWMPYLKMWRKLHDRTKWFLTHNLLWLFHFSPNSIPHASMNLSGLTLSLNFFIHFIKHLLHHGQIEKMHKEREVERTNWMIFWMFLRPKSLN